MALVVVRVLTVSAEWEAQRQARMEGSEDAVAMRLRRADEEKQRKLREFEEKARTRSDELGARETALRERHANADLVKQQALQQMHELNRSKAAAYNQGTCIVYTVFLPLFSYHLFSSNFTYWYLSVMNLVYNNYCDSFLYYLSHKLASDLGPKIFCACSLL